MYNTIPAPNRNHHLLKVPPKKIARLNMVKDNSTISEIGYAKSVIVAVNGCVIANSDRITNPMMTEAEAAIMIVAMVSLRRVKADEKDLKYMVSATASGISALR